MCESCGCGDRSGHAHHHGHADGVHFHRDADGNLYSHRHSSAERVPLGTAILAANDTGAANESCAPVAANCTSCTRSTKADGPK